MRNSAQYRKLRVYNSEQFRYCAKYGENIIFTVIDFPRLFVVDYVLYLLFFFRVSLYRFLSVTIAYTQTFAYICVYIRTARGIFLFYYNGL